MQSDLISSINKKVLTNKDLIALKIIFNSNDGVYKFIKGNLSIEEILSLTEEQLKNFNFRKTEDILIKLSNYQLYEQQSIEVIDWCDENAVKIVSFFDPLYPESIKAIANPSCLIFCLGNINLLNYKNSIAIIGTRKCSEYGEKIAAGVSKYFASNDINIVSGLALGIDTIAHKQSLQCDGKTTAILIDLKQISPPKNKNLAIEIIENGGLLIAENIPGTLPEKYHYVERNRLQAALSKLVFIIEANKDSGTKTTADHAIKQGKQIFCPDLNTISNYPDILYAESLNKYLLDSNNAKTFTKNLYPQILEILSNDT